MSGAPDVAGSLWRALAVGRFITLGHAVLVNGLRTEEFPDPLAAWAVVTAIAAWTLVSTWAYDRPGRRSRVVLGLDLAVGVAALLAGRFILGPELLGQGATLPGFWVISPVLAWAVAGGTAAGVLAAAAVVAADLGSRTAITEQSVANTFLALLTGGVVGYCSTLVRRAARERARAAEAAARTAERDRLARVVHDGVLQVLAYIQRRGRRLGGPSAELARMAGEQEVVLRRLVQDRAGTRPGAGDLCWSLRQLGEPGVSIAAPVDPVEVGPKVAAEVVAAVREVIQNAKEHAPGASVHLLLEVESDAVAVSVRDSGPGIPPGRVEAAVEEGRLGISQSIVGRIEDLGGSAVLHTGPDVGTEWEFRLPLGAIHG